MIRLPLSGRKIELIILEIFAAGPDILGRKRDTVVECPAGLSGILLLAIRVLFDGLCLTGGTGALQLLYPLIPPLQLLLEAL